MHCPTVHSNSLKDDFQTLLGPSFSYILRCPFQKLKLHGLHPFLTYSLSCPIRGSNLRHGSILNPPKLRVYQYIDPERIAGLVSPKHIERYDSGKPTTTLSRCPICDSLQSKKQQIEKQNKENTAELYLCFKT